MQPIELSIRFIHGAMSERESITTMATSTRIQAYSTSPWPLFPLLPNDIFGLKFLALK
ncbi:MAG: hypothetical protein GX491_00850 [Chloroflexi bacterium]|nr:hypothetical protein [Chloroflexota bacterium]